ncbi:MAG: NAD(P)H-hydrate dehydratase [Candidatus Omnitrophica bacterium]|nr:NAD(P)H-hydrate dehydratase [Candidatus Omnitrophota bacterium]
MPSLPRSFFKRRAATHKGDYGHVLVVGGSIGLTGAPVLCARAALRSGAGLVTLAVPESVYFIAAAQLTEVMVHPLSETPAGVLSAAALPALRPLLARANVLALGPGLSTHLQAVHAVRSLVAKAGVPVVLDADGVNAFAGAGRLLAQAKAPVVITPHPGEMARLLGTTAEAVQRNRLKTAVQAARRFKVVAVLKGHQTVTASPAGKTCVNKTGNPGMATAGMGDLLTGIIAALMGQGIAPFEAAKAGVRLHGLAGDLAARGVGQVSLVAGDVLAALPEAFKKTGS